MSENPYSLHSFSLGLLQNNFCIEGAESIHNYLDTFRKEREISDSKSYKVIVVEEEEYVDAFFLRDYSNYYVEAIARTNKMTQRLHFFLFEEDEKEFNRILLKALSEGNRESIDTLDSLYMGFITIKPIPNKRGKKSLGKCFLKPYSSNNGKRSYISCKNLDCSLGGIRFVMDTVPFHQQDIAVGACASATLWMAQFPINEYFSIPIHSLAEITHISSYPYRRAPLYPNDGLQMEEINKYLLDLGLQFHIIELKVLYKRYKDKYNKNSANFLISSLLKDAIRSYVGIGFPIIAILSLKKKTSVLIKEKDKEIYWHAALITGYRFENDEIAEIYMHDDRICPYSRAFLRKKKEILSIKNEWEVKHNYKTTLHSFIIPVPPLLRFSVTQIYEYILNILLKEEVICPISLLEDMKRWGWPGIMLYSVNKYKQELLSVRMKKCTIKEYDGKNYSMEKKSKIDFLTRNCPKYLWILRFKDASKKMKDIVIDATLSTPEIVAEIYY